MRELEQLNSEHACHVKELLGELELKAQCGLRSREQARRLRVEKERQLQLVNDRLKYAEQKHQLELTEIRKSFELAIKEVRVNADRETSRGAELSKHNGELRKRVQSLEIQVREAHEKLGKFKKFAF